ncbi:RDD family protein [Spirosoma sp. KCTC 42546]|uniref:RDD family protein n=1 Tax=Spirosoma sp. KCTC 42546 TaxID=2520506 RepID=UPI00115B3B68|nr:RDD family protein [Spirosoma sp. KCTC 42546]QDK80396.1 RDD family protein [Spirosoma sp. KCTC 42546]
MQPSYTPVSTHVKATPVQRFVAAFIDGIIAYIPCWILIMVSYSLGMVGYAIAIAYMLTKDALPETGGFLGGQSIGKKLMGIKAIKEDTGASLVGDYGTAITRQVSLMIPFFGFVDALMVFSDEGKRFGDKWAKTIVVKV